MQAGVRRKFFAAWIVPTVVMLTVAGCTSQHAGGDTAATTSSPASTLRPVDTSATCPNNNLTNLPQPEQQPASTSSPIQIVAAAFEPYPEGPNAAVGVVPGSSQANLIDQLPAIVSAIGLPLPAALPQGCCQGGGIVHVWLSDGEHITYGPCSLPTRIDDAARLLTATLNS
jgi:hypothetical protein